jgi:hypothetical protein
MCGTDVGPVFEIPPVEDKKAPEKKSGNFDSFFE